MSDRFYVPGTWSERIELEGPESQHLARVLRAEVGDSVEIFDGQGRAASANVAEIKKRSVILQLSSTTRTDPVLKTELVLAVASPKGDRLRWMIEKITELGVDRFIPLKTERSVVQPGETKLAKLEQTVIAACKQCGRNRLLAVDEISLLTELFDRFDDGQTQFLWGDASGEPLKASAMTARRVIAVIGPEGGWSPREREFFAARKAGAVTLSRQILRVETAAVAFASLLGVARLD